MLKERRVGFFGYLVIGIVGSFLGFFLFREFNLFLLLGLMPGHIAGQLLSAFVGAIILLFVMRLVRR